MGNIALQLQRTINGGIAPGGSVVFNLISHSTGNISYDDQTGNITFQEPGRYTVNWFAVMQSSNYPNGIVLTFASANGTAIIGNTNVKTGEVVGIGIIQIDTAPTAFSLKNTSTGSYTYSENLPVKASLVITQDNYSKSTDAYCFAVDQLINSLTQMITAYSAYTWTVYTESLSAFSGMPFDLYTAPGADKPGILRLKDANNDYEALPIDHITAIYPGDGTIYDSGFTYLTPPDSLPHDCNYSKIAAIQAYLPLGTNVAFNLGPAISASGDIYRDEYGLVVLSDDAGNTPIFIPTYNILRIFITGSEDGLSKPGGGEPQIGITK